MTLADYKTLAEICALALAGLWAIYGFVVLRQREKAAAELRKIDLETQKTAQDLRRVALIRADISATTVTRRMDPGCVLLVEVTLVNEGKRDTRLKWKDEPAALSIRRVTFDANGAPVFPDQPILLTVKKTRDPNVDAPSHIIRAGASQQLPFAAQLSCAGLYLLSFRAAVAPDDLAVSVAAGASANSRFAWTATKYILVEHEQSDE